MLNPTFGFIISDPIRKVNPRRVHETQSRVYSKQVETAKNDLFRERYRSESERYRSRTKILFRCLLVRGNQNIEINMFV